MPSAAGTQKRKWVVQPEDQRAAKLAGDLKVSALLGRVLVNRGLMDAQAANAFLKPKLTDLIRPEMMPGVEKAVRRITQAIKKAEKVTIYGDYDVDGITGVAILWQLLKLLGANVDYYIPHRIDEGYGLNEQAVRTLAQAGTKLLITVDCGTCALASCDVAAELGLEVIITDHHEPGEKLPTAAAIVHPALEQAYPNHDSAGAMVAFKLAWAVANEFNAGPKLEAGLRECMLNATVLASMGTIADVVDLRGENRILTTYGLKALPECKLCGVRALIESARLTGGALGSYHIGFRLAPMLNAAGRMGHARLAVELLTSQSETQSAEIAEYLKQQNIRRQQRERKILEQACRMLDQQGLNHPDRKSVCLASRDWHTGIIGIVASRIAEKLHRPAIMFNIDSPASPMAQGSARSIPGFSILDAIAACSKHLTSFGGHKMAAGLTIESEKIPRFAADFEDYAAKNLNEDVLLNKLHIDAVVSLRGFNLESVRELQLLEPFGKGNPKPTFATRAVRLAGPPRKVGAKGDHLQLAITDNTAAVRCIGFRFGKLEKKLLEHEFFDVAYQPQLNEYNGSSSVEFVLEDIRFD